MTIFIYSNIDFGLEYIDITMNEEPRNLLPEALENELKHCKALPILPSVAEKIIEASKNPHITLAEVTSIISSDPALTEKLLKIANSPIYSRRRSVNNLREALTLLGFNAALTIALSFTLVNAIKTSPEHQARYEDYWKRSILSAAVARLLGVKLGLPKVEDLFLVGLLQDIGILVIDCLPTSPYAQYGEEHINHDERVKAEQAALSVEHAQVGAWLLKSWELPERLVDAVLYSHSLNKKVLQEQNTDVTFHYCLNFSGVIADIWLDETPKELMDTTMDALKMFLGLDKTEFNKFLLDLNNELPGISALFEVELIDIAERDRLLDEARELLLDRSVYFTRRSENERREVENISEKVQQLEKLNQIDHLTGIFNRRHFEQLLDEEFDCANMNKWPLSLALIDIDSFKVVNDTYGHLAGDEVLKQLATFFEENIRETDVLARYGGDEFILMLPGSTSAIALGLISRLLTAFSEIRGIKVNGKEVVTTISIGVATHIDRHNFDNVKELISAADEALYKAKQAGKDCLIAYSA